MSKNDPSAHADHAADDGTSTPASAPVPKGYWQSATGALVPDKLVKPIEKDRDALVRDLVQRAQAMQSMLADFKLEVMTQVAGFVARSAEDYGVTIGGDKGNVTLTSFDGRLKVVRQISESLAFDERLQVAKEIIDERVHAWSKGANRNIQALVQHAFQVDKQGQVNTARVLSLRQLQIDDPKWAEAMRAITDSIRVSGSKSYVRFYLRTEADGAWVPVPVDLAAA